MRFIKQAQAVGLTLKDIQVLAASRDGKSRAACRKIRAVLAARITDLDQRMREFQAFRSLLNEYLRSCDQALDAHAEADCPTVDAIARGDGSHREVRS